MAKKHKVLARTLEALNGEFDAATMYDPPLTGTLTLVDAKGHARTYAVAIHGEHDGVWVVKHSRPSGKRNRKNRATHAGTKEHRGPTTQTGVGV